MYSTCLHCARDLGRNDTLETLPIGRRVAFDSAQGRLWVVCRSCERWNLVPFDTRLETIDAAERVFAETRTRLSTDHIGLARVREGLELVRIGPALRPEFAAWRYGDQFGRRRRRNIAVGAGLVVGGVAVAVGAISVGFVGAGAGSYWGLYQFGAKGLLSGWRRRSVVLRLPRRDGEAPLVLTRADLQEVRIRADHSGWDLLLPGQVLRGPEAMTALGRVLPKMAGFSGTRTQVQDAVEVLETGSHPDEVVARYLRYYDDPLKKADPELRLALEMAVHEESERAAMHGELRLLERQWREAEELAAIADSLAVSDDVRRRVGTADV